MTAKPDSALPNITGATIANGDLVAVTDVSDTSSQPESGAGGTTKHAVMTELAIAIKARLALAAADISNFDTQVRTSTLSQMAAPGANVSFNSKSITNLLDPTNAQDADTKNARDVAIGALRALNDGTYTFIDTGTAGVAKVQLNAEIGAETFIHLDSGRKLTGVDYLAVLPLPSCTYSNGTLGVGATLTATANGAFANVDQQTATLGDTVLVIGQAAPVQNGIYNLTQVGTGGTPFILTRDVNFDQAADWANGVDVHVAKGHLHGGRIIKFRAMSYVMGTTGINARTAATIGDIFTGAARDRGPIFEDFAFKTTVATVSTLPIHLDGAEGFWWGTGGAGEQVSQIDTTVSGGETVYGCANLETGTTTTGRVYFTTQQALAFDATNRYEWYARLKVPTVSDGTNTFNVKCGFFDTPDGAPANGLYFEAISGTTNWQAVTRVGGASTNTDLSGITYNTSFRNFAIIVPGDGNAYFYNGPTLVATITSGLPTGVVFYPGAGILKSAGTTNRFLRLDMFGTDFPAARPSLHVP